jgi:hypothetical protein
MLRFGNTAIAEQAIRRSAAKQIRLLLLSIHGIVQPQILAGMRLALTAPDRMWEASLTPIGFIAFVLLPLHPPDARIHG